MYTDYIREFQLMVSVLDETRQRNPEFDKIVTDFEVDANRIRWLYCVEYPQYSIRLEALGYI